MTQESQFSLLKQRRFAPFFWVQFLGAFNVYKNALVILLAFQIGSLSAQESDTLINLSTGLFILSFFLFLATSGQLATNTRNHDSSVFSYQLSAGRLPLDRLDMPE